MTAPVSCPTLDATGQSCRERGGRDFEWCVLCRQVDPATLTPAMIRAAVIAHGKALGSYAYYMQDEIERIERDPAGLVAFLDARTHELRAYYQRPEHRP